MDDPTILTGIAKIVNKRKVNNKLDLDAIERDLIGGGGLTKQPIKDVDAELNDLLKDIRTPAFDRISSEKVVVKPMSSVNEISIAKLQKPPQINVPIAASNKIQQFINNSDPTESDEELMESDNEMEDQPIQTSTMVQTPVQTPIQMPIISRPAYYPPPPPTLPYTVPRPPVATAPNQNYAQEALQVYANDHNVEESIIEQERLEDEKEKCWRILTNCEKNYNLMESILTVFQK